MERELQWQSSAGVGAAVIGGAGAGAWAAVLRGAGVGAGATVIGGAGVGAAALCGAADLDLEQC